MKKSLIDLPVLMIFFARPDTFEKVFEKVKMARPSKLFLACDGAREGNQRDVESVEQCKKIVEGIDWECEVFTRYSSENQGCGKGPSNAISWAFEHTDRLVILEDDCVPDLTFFPYMKELLEKYKDDERIGMISGLNHLQTWDCGPGSYCFTKTGAIWGWGTWKRVWDKYDYHVENIQNEYYQNLLLKEFPSSRIAKNRIGNWKHANKETKEKKVKYWDVQFGFLKYTQSYLTIVPKYNLIYNIGVGVGSTHTEQSSYKKWKKGRVLFMPTTPLELPLTHPEIVVCDRKYDEETFKIVYPGKWKKAWNKLGRMFKKK